MRTWADVTLSDDDDLTARHAQILTLSATGEWGDKHTLAKRLLGRTLTQVLKSVLPTTDKESGSDGAYTSGQNVFTSASAQFMDADVDVNVGDVVLITSSVDDRGTFAVASVASGTSLTLRELDGTAFTFSETQTSVAYLVRQSVLERIIDPVGTFRDAATALTMYLIYDDLHQGVPDSTFYGKAKDAASQLYQDQLRAAISTMEVDLGSDRIASGFERMLNWNGMRLYRGGSPGASASGAADVMEILDDILSAR